MKALLIRRSGPFSPSRREGRRGEPRPSLGRTRPARRGERAVALASQRGERHGMGWWAPPGLNPTVRCSGTLEQDGDRRLEDLKPAPVSFKPGNGIPPPGGTYLRREPFLPPPFPLPFGRNLGLDLPLPLR